MPVIPGSQKKKRAFWNMRRQAIAGSGFIDDGGADVNSGSCAGATLYGVENGQLQINGVPLSTDPGVSYMPFEASGTGSITTTFEIVRGILRWVNVAFTGGEAVFCTTATGQPFVTFAGPDSLPNCTPIQIATYFCMILSLLSPVLLKPVCST
jgi:hypothetical protein